MLVEIGFGQAYRMRYRNWRTNGKKWNSRQQQTDGEGRFYYVCGSHFPNDIISSHLPVKLPLVTRRLNYSQLILQESPIHFAMMLPHTFFRRPVLRESKQKYPIANGRQISTESIWSCPPMRIHKQN